MAEISEVPGIGGSTLELFKRAGFSSAESLVQRSAGEVLAQLDAANREYEVPVRLPPEASVQMWQNSAKSLLRRSGRIEAMPAAAKVDSADLEAAGIDVHAMPVARQIDERESTPLRPQASASRSAGRSGASAGPDRAGADQARAGQSSQRTQAPPGPRPAAGKSGRDAGDPAALLVNRRIEGGAKPPPAPASNETGGNRFRSAEAVQRGKPPVERRNRGMSHPDAGRVRLAATVTVLCLVMSTVAALTLAAALVMAMFYGWHFHWTIALLILVFPFSLFFYLTVGTRVRCRLCGQRLFVPKNCHKHEKAHRSIFGYTFAVARDAAFLGRYRCMLCGTKTRLKD